MPRCQGNLPYEGDELNLKSNSRAGDGEYERHQDKSTEAVSMVPIRMGLARKCILETPAGEGGPVAQAEGCDVVSSFLEHAE